MAERELPPCHCPGAVGAVIGTIQDLPVHECEACGLLYFDRATRGLEQSDLDWWRMSTDAERQTFRGLLDGLRPQFSRQIDVLETLVDGRHIVDVGAGCGLFLAAARDRGWTVRGEDSNPNAAKSAEAAFGLIFAADLASVPDGEADVVRLSHVLEHVGEPMDFLRAIAPKLKQDGVLAIIVPNGRPLTYSLINAWNHLFSRQPKLTAPMAPGFHPLGLSVEALRRMTRAAGYEEIETFSVSMGNPTYYPAFYDGLSRRVPLREIPLWQFLFHWLPFFIDNLGNLFGRGHWLIGYYRKSTADRKAESDDRKIFGNIATMFSGQVVSMAIGLITTAYLARVLGVEGFGILGFGLAFLSYFGLVCNMGADGYGMREISRHPEAAADVSRKVVGLRFAAALVLYAIFAAITALIDQPDRVKTVMWIQGLTLPITALTLDFAFHALERMAVQAVRQSVVALLYLLGVLALISGVEDIYTVAALAVAAQGLAAAWMIVHFRRTVGRFSLFVGAREAVAVAKVSLPMMMTAVMTTIYYNLDIVMLGFLRDQTEVGWYVAAFKVAVLATVGGQVVQAGLMPSMHRAVGSREEQRRQGARLAQAMMAVGAPAAVGGVLYAPEIVGLVFGAAYVPAAPALVILMISVGAQYVTFIYAAKLYAWNHDRAQFVASAVGAMANIGLNALLIPSYGIEGAAVATLVSNVLVMGFMLLFLARRDRPLSLRPIAKVMVAAVLAGAVTWGLDLAVGITGAGPRLALGVVVYGAAYAALLSVFGLARRELLTALWRR